MRIGALNKEIVIESKTQASDGMGSFTDTYSTLYTLWAAIWPVSGKEQIQAMQNAGVVTHKIRIRYRTGILSSYRIKFGSRYFAIVSPPINPDERNEWLEILCKEAT